MFATCFKKEVNDEEKSVVAWANKSDSIDRSGDLIEDEAWDLENFLKNPVIPAFHQYDRPPIGKALWARVIPGQGLKFKVKFASTLEGQEFYELYRDGVLNAFSVGFRAFDYLEREDFKEADIIKYNRNGKLPNRVYKKVELFEVSAAVVPDHMNALVERSASGMIKTKCVMDFAEDAKSSPEYIELLSTQPDSLPDFPMEDKAKVIGFINLSEKSLDEPEEVIEEVQEVQETVENEGAVEEKSETIEEVVDAKPVVETETVEDAEPIEKIVNVEVLEDAEEKGLDLEIINEIEKIGEVAEPETIDVVEEKATDEVKSIKKEINDIILEVQKEESIESVATVEKVTQEEVDRITNILKSCKIKDISDEDKKIISKQYGEEEFDITSVRTEPAGFELKVFCKFLNCKIKNMFVTDFFIPSAMKGNYLSGFRNSLTKHELLDQRNLYGNGGEIPLRHSVIQLNSKRSEEFLTQGTQFYKADSGERFVFQIEPDWGGYGINIYTTDKNIELNKSFAMDAIQWVKENNLLKGEKFSIMGEFLDKKEIGWDDVIFPDEEAKNKVKGSIDRLTKTSPSRGIMLIGPPGTGKTMTGKVLMNQPDTTFIWASSKDFRYGAAGALALGFEMARDLAPSVFFLEDIDTWLKDYTIDLLKTEMDGIRDNKGVLTVLTSNFPEQMPEALIDRPGRFHHIINFSLPNKENRIKLLKFFVDYADKVIIEKFAEETAGYSGSHLKELVEFAKMIAEDLNISIDEALVKSLDQMKAQRQLIIDVRSNKKKGLEIQMPETKMVEFLTSTKKETELNFTPEQVQDIFTKNLKEVFSKINISEIVEDRIKMAKGIIEFE